MVKVHLQMGWLSCTSSLCPVDGIEGVHDFCLSSALPHLPVKGGCVGDKHLLPCVLLGSLVSLLPEGEDRAARWDRK